MTGEVQNNIWPLPKFYFSVTIGGNTVSFQEVTGLDSEAERQAAPLGYPDDH